MELLSQGADLSIPSSDGNNALHFAALNERKGIVEILLRSGADPSVPNHAGLLPIELSKTTEVSELFLRDRSSIFSPIASVAQSRVNFSEFTKQGGEIMSGDSQQNGYYQVNPFESPTLHINIPSVVATAGSFSPGSESLQGSSGKMPIFNMNSEFENEENSPVPVAHSSSESEGDLRGVTEVGVQTPLNVRPNIHNNKSLPPVNLNHSKTLTQER